MCFLYLFAAIWWFRFLCPIYLWNEMWWPSLDMERRAQHTFHFLIFLTSSYPCCTSGQSTISSLTLSKSIGIANSKEFWEYNCQSRREYARETAIAKWSALHVIKCNTKGGFRSKYTCIRILEKLQRLKLVLNNLLTWWGLGNSFGTMTLFIWYVVVTENIGHI